MDKTKILKRIKTVVIVVVCIIAVALLMHLTLNYFVPFVANIHNKGGAY